MFRFRVISLVQAHIAGGSLLFPMPDFTLATALFLC